MKSVPKHRIRIINNNPIRAEGQYVLYWMTAYRRTQWNFALQRAVEVANQHKKPLLIIETLHCDEPYANDRLHQFALQGMKDNLSTIGSDTTYYPYVESCKGTALALLKTLSEKACLVVTDDYPSSNGPQLIDFAGNKLPVCVEAIDGNGLLPMRVADHAYPTAYAFRRFLQKNLPQHLMEWPDQKPLAKLENKSRIDLPASIMQRYPDATTKIQAKRPFPLEQLPIDHTVKPASTQGGRHTAIKKLTNFLEENLNHYADDRNHPDLEATSGLSSYLHFGHMSSHEIFAAIIDQEEWTPHDLSERTDGKRTGWWRLSESAEAFLDQLVTWRELGFNMCCFEPQKYMKYESLPEWAQKTLDEHRRDSRPYCYSLETFLHSKTHDSLWNAAQNQLRKTGVLHNYLRMLWGKKILEWTKTPEEALDTMIELNDRLALDGRDPNSYSGIFWCLGRYDRAWGPERDIFGKIRYMSSDNTRRKLQLDQYLEQYGQSED